MSRIIMELKALPSDGPVLRMAVHGRISCGNWTESKDLFTAVHGDEVYRKPLLLSLADSPHMDSSGAGWLLSCHKRFQDAGGKLVIHSANPTTTKLLRLMRLELVLAIAEDESAAKARIGSFIGQPAP